MSLLKFGFVLTFIVGVYSELVPVYIDPVTNRMYIEQKNPPATANVQYGPTKVLHRKEKQVKVNITPKISPKGASVTFGYEKRQVWTREVEMNGGCANIPFYESCVLQKECRDRVVGLTELAIKDGVALNQLKEITGK
jgi:hypothetical protein